MKTIKASSSYSLPLYLLALLPMVFGSTIEAKPHCNFQALKQVIAKVQSLTSKKPKKPIPKVDSTSSENLDPHVRTGTANNPTPFHGHVVAEFPGRRGQPAQAFSTLSQLEKNLDSHPLGSFEQPFFVQVTDKNGDLRLKSIVVDEKDEHGHWVRTHREDLSDVYRVVEFGHGERVIVGKSNLDAFLANKKLSKVSAILKWSDGKWVAAETPEGKLFEGVIAEIPDDNGARRWVAMASIDHIRRSEKLGKFQEPVIVYQFNEHGELVPVSAVLDRLVRERSDSEPVYKRTATTVLENLVKVSRPDGSSRVYSSGDNLSAENDMGTFAEGRGLVYRLHNGVWKQSYQIKDLDWSKPPSPGDLHDPTAGYSPHSRYVRWLGLPETPTRGGPRVNEREIRNRRIGLAASIGMLGGLGVYLSTQQVPVTGSGGGSGLGQGIILEGVMGVEAGDESGIDDVVFEIAMDSNQNNQDTKPTQREMLAALAEAERQKQNENQNPPSEHTTAQAAPTPTTAPGTNVQSNDLAAISRPLSAPPSNNSEGNNSGSSGGTETKSQQGDPTSGVDAGAVSQSREAILRGGSGSGGQKGPAFFGISTGQHDRIVFLVDVSSSMEGISIEALRFELSRAIENLPDNCAFNILPFGDTCTPWRPDVVFVSRFSKDKAKQFVAAMRAESGTNFDAAFMAAMAQKPQAIFFLTDGQSGISQQSLDATEGVVVNTIAFGAGTDTKLLEEIARRRNGKFILVK